MEESAAVQQNTGVDAARSAKSTGFSILLLGVLLSLIVKSALDHSFTTLPAYADATHLWDSFAKAPGRRLLILFNLLVFLFTVVRFYAGAYRYAESSKNDRLPEAFTTVVGTFVLFSGLYVASLTLGKPPLYYWAVIAFHLVDFLWFFVVQKVLRLPEEVSVLVGVWQMLDFLTMIGIAVCMLLTRLQVLSWLSAQVSSSIVLLVLGVLDLCMFMDFYLAKSNWAATNRFIKWKLAR